MIFFWKHGPRNENKSDGLCSKKFTYPNTTAILNKIANIIHIKCCKKCNGVISNQLII